MLLGIQAVTFASGKLAIVFVGAGSSDPGPPSVGDERFHSDLSMRIVSGGFVALWQTTPGGPFRRRWEWITEGMGRRFSLVKDPSGLIYKFYLNDFDDYSSGGLIPPGLDGQLKCSHQLQPDGTWVDRSWTDPIDLGGHRLVEVSATIGLNSLINVFVVGQDHNVYVCQQTSVGAPNFSPFVRLGGNSYREIHAYQAHSGAARCVAVTTNGDVHSIYQSANAWSSWDDLAATQVQHLSVVRAPTGQAAVFALGGDQSAWVNYDSPTRWLGWTSLGGTKLTSLVGAVNQDGRVECMAVGSDLRLYHRWTDGGGNWQPWASEGGANIEQIAVGQNADGRLQVFAAVQGSKFKTIYQLVPNGSFGNWEDLPRLPPAPPGQQGKVPNANDPNNPWPPKNWPPKLS